MNDHAPSTPRDEAEWIRRLKNGDGEAFARLVGLFQEKLFRIAYGITLDRQESEDIVQDVFLKAYENIHAFREESAIVTWLHRITVNHCLNWRRRWARRLRWRHQPLEMEDGSERPDLGTDADSPDRYYDEKEMAELFDRHFKALPEEARAVFVLKEIEGLSYEQIAETLGIKRGTVSSRLFYARRRLKEALEPYK